MNALLSQIVLQRLELQNEERCRIDPDDLGRPRTKHTPAVVAVAAAHVEHTPTPKRRDRARQAFPFPIRPPLGIDVQPAQLKRPFAPGVEPH